MMYICCLNDVIMDLILSSKGCNGQVSVLTDLNILEIRRNYHVFFDSINLKNSVLVVFYTNLQDNDYPKIHDSILVSQNFHDVRTFIEKRLSYTGGFAKNISIFEFSTYEEAFKYCIDLKQGL